MAHRQDRYRSVLVALPNSPSNYSHCVTPSLTKISPYIRAVLVIFVGLSIWQLLWLSKALDSVEFYIPAVQDANMWQAAWTVILISSLVAALTGRDVPARIAFGAMAVVTTLGAVTIWSSTEPMEYQFYPFGLSVTLAACCYILLLSPLRPAPGALHFFSHGVE
jgi:hypothetical protein